MSEPRHTNRLAGETSPYLLQHAHNPVDWHPWGPEALAKARDEGKPILLSIGYSACHWCHVMERESFENEEIARVMNENFINIKVDREERPDIDAIYMNAVQLMTGRGGWPLTVFLTPDQAPFYGGTYFPPDDRYGVPGFRRVLAAVSQGYSQNRERIKHDARESARRIEAMARMPMETGTLDRRLLEKAVSSLTADYDSVNGGFGAAPKFPPSMTLAFLMRAGPAMGSDRLREIVDSTLQRMAAGGIYDQIGGGFHRYSVDAEWLVPHFEKMLYDNALLSRCYLEAYLLTGNEDYRRVTVETLDYLLREMRSPEGGFYSSQDADSEGSEGKFYTWSYNEVEGLLGPETAALFALYYGVSREGNFEGLNILHIPRPAETVARIQRIPVEELIRAASSGKRTLMSARQGRVYPHRDEKVLTSWNALTMQSLAEAGSALERDDYRDAARDNAKLLLRVLLREGRLLRSYKDGKAKQEAYLEDYAFLVEGLLSLYESTFEVRWLREAENLAETMLAHFQDPRGGGFFLTADDHETLIHRPKDIYDNATPSGSSAAVRGLLRLWHLTGEERWLRPAESTLEGMAGLLEQHPRAFPNLLCALDAHLSGCSEIAIIGLPADPDAKTMLRSVFSRFLPNRVVACGMQGEPQLLRGKSQVGGQTTAYVCRNGTCLPPVTSAAALSKMVTGLPVPLS